MRKRKSKMKFIGRKHSLYGMISSVLGGVNLLLFILLIVITTNSAGTTGVWLGLAGLLLLVISLAGALLGVAGFKQKDVFYRFPIIGVTTNGVLFLCYVILYFFGLSNMIV